MHIGKSLTDSGNPGGHARTGGDCGRGHRPAGRRENDTSIGQPCRQLTAAIANGNASRPRNSAAHHAGHRRSSSNRCRSGSSANNAGPSPHKEIGVSQHPAAQLPSGPGGPRCGRVTAAIPVPGSDHEAEVATSRPPGSRSAADGSAGPGPARPWDGLIPGRQHTSAAAVASSEYLRIGLSQRGATGRWPRSVSLTDRPCGCAPSVISPDIN